MKGFQIQQKGERRISAALRIMLVIFLLAVQIALVVAISYFMQEYLALAYAVVQVAALFLAIRIYNEPGELSYKLIWFILLLLAPPVGMILWFLWGGAAQKRHLPQNGKRVPDEPESVRKRSALAVERLTRQLPGWSRTANYLCRRDFQLYQDTRVTYLPEGALLLRELIEQAKKAERFIFLEYFILAEGRLWSELEKILCTKAREGVEVKIIFDDFGNIKRFRGETIDRLRDAGVEVFIFNPVHEYVNRLYFNYRDHRKIACFDGDVAYTGGVNIADEYANLIERFGYWKDSGVRLDGPGAASLANIFLTFWKAKYPDEDLDAGCDLPAAVPVETDCLVQPFADTPVDREAVAKNVYLELINQAQKRLYICTPYLILDNDLLSCLRLAAKRGVDVRIYTPGVPDKPTIYQLTRSYFPHLLRAGVKIYSYTPGFLHAKTWLVDDRIAAVGTVNLDYRSLYLHFENSVLLYGGAVLDDVRRDLAEIEKESAAVTLADCRTGFFGTLYSAVLRLVAPLC